MEDHSNGKQNEKRQCAACQRELGMGDDCQSLQKGVIGPRGFVPLGDPKHFCDYICTERYFNGNDQIEKLPRRIP